MENLRDLFEFKNFETLVKRRKKLELGMTFHLIAKRKVTGSSRGLYLQALTENGPLPTR